MRSLMAVVTSLALAAGLYWTASCYYSTCQTEVDARPTCPAPAPAAIAAAAPARGPTLAPPPKPDRTASSVAAARHVIYVTVEAETETP